jgi:hypothetical protein
MINRQPQQRYAIGLVGLGVMGRSLVPNIDSRPGLGRLYAGSPEGDRGYSRCANDTGLTSILTAPLAQRQVYR